MHTDQHGYGKNKIQEKRKNEMESIRISRKCRIVFHPCLSVYIRGSLFTPRLRASVAEFLCAEAGEDGQCGFFRSLALLAYGANA
jgi:hypothetical protein